MKVKNVNMAVTCMKGGCRRVGFVVRDVRTGEALKSWVTRLLFLCS